MKRSSPNTVATQGEMNNSGRICAESNVPKKKFANHNMTGVDYRRELSNCKGKIKQKKKKSEASKKKRAEKRKQQLIKEGRLKPFKKKETCKFHKSGKCMKDNKCQYYHPDIIEKRPEVCRRFSNGFCPRGPECIFMHGEFPCRFYHLFKTCFAGIDCRFSHAPLNAKSRQILMNSMAQAEKKAENAEAKESSEPVDTPSKEQFPASSSVENGAVKLNFYVDTLDESSKKEEPVHEVDLDSLFMPNEPDCPATPPPEKSTIDLNKLLNFSPMADVVYVKQGRILTEPKQFKRMKKVFTTNRNNARPSSGQGSITPNEESQSLAHSRIMPFKLGFFSSTLKRKAEELEAAKKYKRFILKHNIVDMVRVLAGAKERPEGESDMDHDSSHYKWKYFLPGS